MLLGEEHTLRLDFAEDTCYIFLFKRCTPQVDNGSSLDWSNKWCDVYNVRWVEVSELDLFVSVVLVVD